MATVQQLYDRAMSKSARNNADTIAVPSEIVAIGVQAQRGLFALAARVGPEYFGDEDEVTYSSPGWPRPAAAESVLRIEVFEPGDEYAVPPIDDSWREVKVVPLEDRFAEAFHPSVYRLGGVYRSVGREIDPDDSETLRFTFARRPVDPTVIGSSFDPAFPDMYDELLVLEIAIYAALKDEPTLRAAEIAALKAERDGWLIRFVAFLEHETANVTRRHARIRNADTDMTIPLGALVAGGSTAV